MVANQISKANVRWEGAGNCWDWSFTMGVCLFYFAVGQPQNDQVSENVWELRREQQVWPWERNLMKRLGKIKRNMNRTLHSETLTAKIATY